MTEGKYGSRIMRYVPILRSNALIDRPMTTARTPELDRFDICAAHEAIEVHFNLGGWLHERASNQRRREATHVQLHRMGYHSAPTSRDCFDALTPNGKRIYRALERRYGFRNTRAA